MILTRIGLGADRAETILRVAAENPTRLDHGRYLARVFNQPVCFLRLLIANQSGGIFQKNSFILGITNYRRLP